MKTVSKRFSAWFIVFALCLTFCAAAKADENNVCQVIIDNSSGTSAWEALWGAISGDTDCYGEDIISITLESEVTCPDSLVIPLGKTVTIDLNGNTISRELRSAVDGGSVIIVEGTLYLKDSVGNGTITGGYTTGNGGGVYVTGNGTFNMSGGMILGNYGFYGGGVYVDGGTFNMSGGQIKNNSATSSGGGVYVCGGTFNISGSPIISGNTGSGKPQNVYLPSGTYITVTGWMSGQAYVGVTLAGGSGVFTNTKTKDENDNVLPDYNDLDRFISDDATAYLVGKNDGKQLLLGTPVTLSFDANGGIGTMESYDVACGIYMDDVRYQLSPQPGYQFSGWLYTDSTIKDEPWEGGTITEDTTFIVQWAPRTYIYTFDPNGGVGTMEPPKIEITYGDHVNGKLPANQYTRTGYTFDSWKTDRDEGETTFTDQADISTFPAYFNNVTLYAQWKPIEYTITWLNDDGSVIDTTSVPYDSTPTHEDVSKKATAQYTYTFAGWTPTITDVKGDAEYKAVFNSSVNQYNVTWLDNDGKTLKTEDLDYGTTPSYSGDDPTKEADEDSSYIFTGWTPEIEEVKADAVYIAAYEAVPKSALTFDLGEGSLDGKTGTLVIKACIGDEIEIPEGPELEGYTFLYWEGSEYYPGDKYTVTGSHTFTAVYEKDEPPVPTGNGTQTVLWLGLMLASALGIAAVLGKKRLR